MTRGSIRTVGTDSLNDNTSGYEEIVELLQQVGQRLIHSEHERRELRRTLEDIAEKADQGERAYLTIQDRLNKTESLIEKRQKAIEKIQLEQTEKIEKAAAMADRIEEAIAQHEKIARRLDRVMQDKTRMLRKLERIEEAVIETQDVVKSRELALPLTGAMAAAVPAVDDPKADTLKNIVAKVPAASTQEEGQDIPLWRQHIAMRATAVSAMVILGVLGGFAISGIKEAGIDFWRAPSVQEKEVALLTPPVQSESADLQTLRMPEPEDVASVNSPAPLSDMTPPEEAVMTPETEMSVQEKEGQPKDEQPVENATESEKSADENAAMKMDDAELLSRMEENPDALAAQLNNISPSDAARLIDEIHSDAGENKLSVVTQAAFTKEVASRAPEAVKKQEEAPIENFLKSQTDSRSLRERISEDKTLPAAILELQKKAFDGIAEAQHDLAAIYTAGHAGVPTDYAKAAQWFKEAALNGVANARYNLGVLYHQGMGVKADMAVAVQWYRAAAEMGHPEAQYNLAIAYIEGIGMPYNPEKAAYYFRQSAEKGIMEAAYNLGLIHENGLTGAGKAEEALYWYKKAADLGSPEAKAAMDQLAKTLELTPDDVEKIYQRYAKDTQVAAQEKEAKKSSSVKPQESLGSEKKQTLKAPEENKASVEYIEAQPLEPEPSSLQEPKSNPVLDKARAEEKNPAIIAQIQEQLIRMGLYPGPADGVMDDLTEDAIRAYQADYSLDTDGRPSQALLVHMMTSNMEDASMASGSR